MDTLQICLRSVGTALPGPPVSNAALATRFAMPSAWQQWVETFVGIEFRHFCVDLDTGEIRHSLTDLGETAARRAMDAAGLSAADVDVMVLGTSSPDRLMPATVNEIADRLGVDGIPTYQLQSGCSGAVQALDIACHMLRSGTHRTALVLGGDSCAKHFDAAVDLAALPPAQQINGVLFGDGVGAAVLTTEPTDALATIRHTFVRLNGLGRPPGQIVRWRGAADPRSAEPVVAEDYKAIEAAVPGLAADALTQVLDALDWKSTELDYLLPPQLSPKMTARIVERMAVTGAHEVSCVGTTGNTGNALPFFQLERALPRMVEGDRAIAVTVESSKWITAGLALEKR